VTGNAPAKTAFTVQCLAFWLHSTLNYQVMLLGLEGIGFLCFYYTIVHLIVTKSRQQSRQTSGVGEYDLTSC